MNQVSYETLLTKKRKWSTVRPTYQPLVEGATDVISRVLSLRALEIPVGNFIAEATRKDIPPNSINLLLSNIDDEIRHDEALNFAAESFGDKLVDYSKQSQQIVQTWIDAPEHPVLKAMVLERSVFFVILPILRFLGNSPLRTVSADISGDEQIHVLANSLFCKDMGIKLTNNLNKLRVETVEWMVDTVGEVSHKAVKNTNYLSKEFWLKQSDDLLYKGAAPDLSETKVSTMKAFFEQDNTHLPNYTL